jgi:hypothetical protein
MLEVEDPKMHKALGQQVKGFDEGVWKESKSPLLLPSAPLSCLSYIIIFAAVPMIYIHNHITSMRLPKIQIDCASSQKATTTNSPSPRTQRISRPCF